MDEALNRPRRFAAVLVVTAVSPDASLALFVGASGAALVAAGVFKTPDVAFSSACVLAVGFWAVGTVPSLAAAAVASITMEKSSLHSIAGESQAKRRRRRGRGRRTLLHYKSSNNGTPCLP